MTTVGVGDYFAAALRNRQSAHACASLGWVVVPWKLHGTRKVPTRKGWTQAGALRGSEVAEWWANNNGDIPGVVTGAESGIWVLDIDPRNGGNDSIAKLDAVGALGRTFRVNTPGGGWHLYFTWPVSGVEIASRPLPGYPGLDVKGTGGFVAAPGAMVDFEGDLREYSAPGVAQIATAPEWLIEIVRGSGPGWASDGADHSDVDGTEDEDAAWLQSEFQKVSGTLPGSQHEALRGFVLQMRVRGMKREVALHWAVRTCEAFVCAREPWTEDDAERLVAGTWARIPPGTVDAQLKGWAQEQVPSVTVSETPEGAAQPAGNPLPPPPPSSVVVLGEAPQVIGLDDENAQDLLRFAKDRLIWLEGSDWQVWDQMRWHEDVGLHRHSIVRDLGLELVRRAGSGGLTEDDRKKVIGRYNRLGTVQGRDACLNYARYLFAVSPQILDSDLWALNTKSGLVDLRTGVIRPAVPTDYVTQLTSCEYRQGETDEVWERVVRQALPDEHDRAWLQRWMGYCLTGLTTEKAILAMHGPANSMKSTVTEPLARALGSYAITWDSETIVKNSKVNVEEALWRARGARLVVINEMKAGTRLDPGVIKSATGTDTVTARALYHASFNYRPQFKLWIHTNHVPNARDDALLERMLFLRMTSSLERSQRDPGIKRWLEEGAAAAVMWWAVQGLLEMVREGGPGLGRPSHSDEEVEEHALRSDPIRRFIADMLDSASNVVTPWDDVHTCYQMWCINEGLKPMGSTTFAHAMKERGVEKTYEYLWDGRRAMATKGWSIRSATISV